MSIESSRDRTREIMEKYISENIGSGDPERESFARLLSTGIISSTWEWVLDEGGNRDTHPAEIAAHLIKVATAIGGMILSTAKNGAEERVAEIFCRRVQESLDGLVKEMQREREAKRTRATR